MKLSEKMFLDHSDDKLIVKKTYDPTDTIEEVAAMRSAGLGHTGEHRHIGRVPGWLITHWLKEAGVKWDDTKARDDVIKKKMMSGEYSAFRNWQGAY